MAGKAQDLHHGPRHQRMDPVNSEVLGAEIIGILDTIDLPVIVVGRDCKVARFNRAAADSLGATATDVGRPACDLEALATVTDFDETCSHVMADEVASRFEMAIADRRFLVRIAPYAGNDSQVHGAVLTFTNITAFRASLGQAIYEREFTKTILNAMVDPLVVLDRKLAVQTANRAFYDWFGASREGLRGIPLTTLGDDGWRSCALWASLEKSFDGHGEFPTMELERNFPAVGRRIILIDASRLVRDGAALILLSFRDITKRKLAEQALRESETRFRKLFESMNTLYDTAQRDLASRERAEALLRETDRRKDEFLAILAHELRNPLAPIRQASAVSKAATATADQKRWSHEVIERQVKQMALLLDDLLDISRVTRGTLPLRLQSTTLTSIIETAIETARPIIEAKSHTLNIEIADEPARFDADPLRLSQVLSNLLTNAAKYTDPGGEIRLRASCDSDTVTFSVADSGIGIPAHALADIFSMFSQIKSGQDRSEGGLGVGLALAKGLMQLHHGTLEVSSDGIGRGSEFIAKLPRHGQSSPSDQVAPPVAAAAPRKKVLIADDNHDAADSLAILLRMEGHDVTVVYDGSQAVAEIEAAQPEIAVLDIGMPELDGYEVAKLVRASSTGSAVTLIAVTGWGQALDKTRASAAGFNHHFTKPVELEHLAQLLSSV
jgi:PAS domain S-box-containing protein